MNKKRFRICRIQNLFLRIHILHKQTQHLQNLQNCSQNKRGSEFLQNAEILGIPFFTNKTKIFRIVKQKMVRNLHNSESILRINSSETNPKFAEFAELFFVCVVLLASPVPPILLLLLLLLVVVVVGRGARNCNH